MSTPHRPRPLTVLVLAAALAAFPLGALASHDFADVPDSNIYHADISALAASGVTTGCGGGNFCPSAFVTREQMAAFMNRLGALAAGKIPVVNADKLDGLDSTDFLAAGLTQVTTWGPIEPDTNDPPDAITGGPGYTLIQRGSAGAASVHVPLLTPLTVDGVARGWVDVEVCFAGSANVTLDQWEIYQRFGDAGSTTVADDATDHSLASNSCFTLNADAYPNGIYPQDGPLGLQLTFAFAASGSAAFSTVTVTWAPV